MRKILKYNLSLEHTQTLVIPARDILSVMRQGNNIVVYAVHDVLVPLTEFNFTIYGTGHQIPDYCTENNFLGTVNMGDLVWHVFVKKGGH